MERNIDAVITWVDGNDPAYKARMGLYGEESVFSRDDVAGATRYANIGEINWCVASINRFAPFVRKIWIVTDGQDPHLGGFMARNFPEGCIPMEIIDHKTIFRGYEHVLPVFNSLSIETMLWRIPRLSERFIYFNDDFMLSSPVCPEDFFTRDGVVCHASWQSTFLTDLTRAWKTLRHGGQKQVTSKGQIRNAVKFLGGGPLYLRYGHTPKPLLRSYFEDYFANRPDALLQNISHRFRSETQFCPEELLYMGLYRAGRCEVRKLDGKLFFFQMKDRPHYLERKLRELYSGDRPFCCFNSLDRLPPADRGMIVAWIKDRLKLKDE